MQNLDLRKKVAEANGCKVKMINICQKHLPYCDCEDHRHASGVCYLLPPYELDHHAAIDALEEFCERNALDYFIEKAGKIRQVRIYKYPKADEPLGFCIAVNDKARAICEAIVKAAEKTEKKEARE